MAAKLPSTRRQPESNWIRGFAVSSDAVSSGEERSDAPRKTSPGSGDPVWRRRRATSRKKRRFRDRVSRCDSAAAPEMHVKHGREAGGAPTARCAAVNDVTAADIQPDASWRLQTLERTGDCLLQ
ncbi:hypothetical protein EYF80_047941 [Liparis tanakae]|uniref:Uncharacterized protein n=1 Tax=Liparis tanakae TaxID=230148 RepID=A0A4Z2FKY9_9TELE|nr:hypothetical protein EYF80_047941 [Liparis tanakae]